VNKFLRSLLKTSLHLLVQSDRVLAALEDNEDRAFDFRTRRPLHSHDERIVASAISFAAGIGLGVGVGLLVAPASGKETRGSVVGKVQEFSKRTRDHFSFESAKAPSGTEGK
jgi:hypothetical protein